MRTFNHCPHCGTGFAAGSRWPRTCGGCGETTWRNPVPVAVALVQIAHEGEVFFLTVRRSIEPRKGLLALPGGFMEVNEEWNTAAARELREETGLTLAEDRFRLFDIRTTPTGALLIFAIVPSPIEWNPARFVSNEEVSEVVLLKSPHEIDAFPLHADVAAQWQHFSK